MKMLPDLFLKRNVLCSVGFISVISVVIWFLNALLLPQNALTSSHSRPGGFYSLFANVCPVFFRSEIGMMNIMKPKSL